MSIVALVRIYRAYSTEFCIEKRKIELTGFETVSFDI